MGKNKKKRKRHALFHSAAVRSDQRSTTTTTTSNEEATDGCMTCISEQDLEVTIRTLQTMTEHSHVLQSKACKELRRMLHPLVLLQMQSYERIDYGTRVTLALQRNKWADATLALQGAHDFGQIPKQGTIQRWVKDCDQATDTYKMKLLRAILRLTTAKGGAGGGRRSGNGWSHTRGTHQDNHNHTGPQQDVLVTHPAVTTTTDDNDNSHNELVILQGWHIPGEDGQPQPHEVGISLEEQPPFESFTETVTCVCVMDSKIIYREHGADRKPPNKFDLLLHTTTRPGTIRWAEDPPSKMVVTKHDISFLPGAFCLDHVLTKKECLQFQHAATKLGFRPDHPVSMNKPTGIDSCEWLVDASIHSVLFSRVQAFLPQTMTLSSSSSTTTTTTTTATTDGHSDVVVSLHSINPRWRFFRYAQDCVYRPHLDGSWPESRITARGEYECDESSSSLSSSSSGNVKSYLTFLIYLNDDFVGGETRFYQYNHSEDQQQQGILTARGVIPKMGAVLVFPQANTASLIHEGSAVTKGSKLVVRTDVMYRVSNG